MRVPIRWLNDFVRVEDIEINALADLFLSIGFEVEEIENLGAKYNNIVTGKIVSIDKHTKADTLSITLIDAGEYGKKTIVTGAKNIAVGDIVPVALSGAVVSGGKEIKDSDLRGVLSEGMLCSGKELDIDDNTIDGAEVNGILILPKTTKAGLPIAKALDVDEYVFDISVGSNRPDCNSIYGLAKEIAVKLERKITPPDLSYPVEATSFKEDFKMPKILIEDFSLCSRYYGNIISSVKIEKSPAFMRKRLIAAGLRPINNVVDITNYVLLELGQPLHAFDLYKLTGDVHVRRAKKGETLLALNEIEYKLDENMLVIADDCSPLAIAGVMGGEPSSITEDSSLVFLETARFAKMSVRSTSRALGLRSDSSARFERGVDYESVDMGRHRALNLFHTLGAGRIFSKNTFSESPIPDRKRIHTSYQQINSLLGIEIPKVEMLNILTALGFEIIDGKDGEFECIVPLFREDVDNFSDLSEEVIRFYGYDKITSTNMESASLTMGEIPPSVLGARRLKNVLLGAGLYEIINFSFIAGSDIDKLCIDASDALRQQIRIQNPLGEDRAFMRTQLLSSMIRTLQLNKSRQNDNVALFELAKVFIPKSLPLKELPNEPYTLCIGLCGKDYDFYALKNIIRNIFEEFNLKLEIKKSNDAWLHSGISADILVNGEKVGSFGKIHPNVSKNFDASEDIYLLQMNVNDIISRERQIVKVAPLPKYPSVDRDLAVVVKSEITAGEVIDRIREAAGGYLERASLFDVYTGGQIENGYKSMAFSLRLRSPEKTLQESDTQTLMSAIITNLESKCGARLR